MGNDRYDFCVILGKLADGLDEVKQRCFRLSFHYISPQLHY
jgi:hypothetical protein